MCQHQYITKLTCYQICQHHAVHLVILVRGNTTLENTAKVRIEDVAIYMRPKEMKVNHTFTVLQLLVITAVNSLIISI